MKDNKCLVRLWVPRCGEGAGCYALGLSIAFENKNKLICFSKYSKIRNISVSNPSFTPSWVRPSVTPPVARSVSFFCPFFQ